MSITNDTHDTTGTLVLITIAHHILPDLAEAITRADLEGRDVKLALEIEPKRGNTAALKVKVGSGTWTISLGNVLLQDSPLFDA